MNKNNKNNKNKFNVKAIVANRGFYIALLTLIMVVGTVAVVRKFTVGVSTNSVAFDDKAWEDAIANADIDAIEIATDTQIPIEENVPEPQEDFPKITSGETVTASKEQSVEDAVKELNMAMPCDGEISRKHSPDKLLYSKTTDDWRTHNGIDILSKKGAVVSAVADGVVEEVFEDEKLGVVVVIGHGNNIKTLYGNLQDLSFIEVGRKVAKGDAVGSVGDTSLIEKKDDPHLHFEVIFNNASQNPSEYIPL